jgi:hypothetical protein
MSRTFQKITSNLFTKLFRVLRNPIPRNKPLARATEAAVGVGVFGAEGFVLGAAALHAPSPAPPTAGLQLAPHQRDDLRFAQAELRLDGIEGGAVFPRHFYYAVDVLRTQVVVHIVLTTTKRATMFPK